MTVRADVRPLAVLAVAQVIYGRGAQPRPPAATRALLALMLATSWAEATAARGPRRGSAVMLCPAALGFAAEVVGVASGWPFGRYSYSEKLGARVAGVPVLAAAAWSMMARPAWVTAGWVSPRAVARVPLAATALTAWDVYLDPRMVAQGYWRWPAGGRYEGVPASNFAGWLIVGLALSAAMAALDDHARAPRDDGALLFYAWTWLGEAFANALLWRRRRTAVAGAAAMGAVALPALRARRRCAS
jgi:putative membrane protein